ncbi:MAG: TlpA family protein disulfide reductase [Aquificaceae bacterium]|nr:TlpA family protein disulfide reductase [Aquificaceae bacterium]MCX8164854.1 TlpA family protein disulfide reductase [Aquificaceae bacterium]
MSRLLIVLLPLLLLSCGDEKLPKIPVKTLDNKTVYLSDYRGKDVLLYVWSRTCAGHTKDLKKLTQIAEAKKDYTIISYAVAMETQDVVRSYKELGIDGGFVTLVDTGVRLNDHIPITFLPSTYLFDKRGRFLRAYPGLYTP